MSFDLTEKKTLAQAYIREAELERTKKWKS